MNINIHTIKPCQTSKRKRIGRGNASGHGTYSGKGQKGQKSRAGVSNLKRLGMKQVLLRTPKVRGFKSDKPKNRVVNLADLNLVFQDKDELNPQILLDKKLIGAADSPVKILGKGKLKVKDLRVSGVLLSETARQQIEKLGGQVK